MDTYIVYIRVDSSNRVLEINSSAFLTDTTGWTQIDEGWGGKYHHAQGNYFPRPIYTEDGIPRYKLVDGQAVERTQEEIEADRAQIPEPPPSIEDRVSAVESGKADRADVDELNQALDMILEGVTGDEV